MMSKNFKYAFEGLICSASGWRKKFSLTDTYLQDYDALFFYYAIKCFVYQQEKEYKQVIRKKNTQEKSLKTALQFAIALDTRDASKELATIARYAVQYSQSTLSSSTQLPIFHSSTMLGIVPIPAALSYTKAYADALIFVTASHNPKEYSGIKFCQSNGQVFVPTANKKLVSLCMSTAKKELANTFTNTQIKLLSSIRSNIYIPQYHKKHSRTKSTTHGIHTTTKASLHENTHTKNTHDSIITEYANTLEKAVFRNSVYQSSLNIQSIFIQKIQEYTQRLGTIPSLLWDVNGGSRCWQGDALIFKKYGIGLDQINTIPGKFVHEIVPEGTSLDQAAQTLHIYNTKKIISTKNKKMYLFAIVSDCDGDRGNTILYNFEKQTYKYLSAQEIFSLVLMIELAWERFIQNNTDLATSTQQKNTQKKLAIVINDASSLRINTIAKQYKVPIFRSEVGEANIVSLASELRKKKYSIPLSGEASNGGIIMHPSFVRDPLHTSFSLLKAVLFFKELFPHLNRTQYINPLIALVYSLPKAASTSTEDSLAKLTIPALSMSQVFYRIIHKKNLLLPQIISLFKSKKIEIDSYTFISHSGSKTTIIDTTTVTKNNTLKGGLSLYLYTKQNPTAMLWLRKSATEPIVRIIADVVGNYATYLERKSLHLWRTFLCAIL